MGFAARPRAPRRFPKNTTRPRHGLCSDAIDFGAPPCGVDNGAPWLVVRCQSARDCLALEPDAAALEDMVRAVGTHGLAVYAPHEAGGPAGSKCAA